MAEIPERIWIAAYTAGDGSSILGNGVLFRSIHDSREDAEGAAQRYHPDPNGITIGEYVAEARIRELEQALRKIHQEPDGLNAWHIADKVLGSLEADNLRLFTALMRTREVCGRIPVGSPASKELLEEAVEAVKHANEAIGIYQPKGSAGSGSLPDHGSLQAQLQAVTQTAFADINRMTVELQAVTQERDTANELSVKVENAAVIQAREMTQLQARNKALRDALRTYRYEHSKNNCYFSGPTGAICDECCRVDKLLAQAAEVKP
jgi:hypothetical protein